MWQNLSTFIFGEPVRDHLPARVLEQIQARQDASERLISWAQFVLIVLPVFGIARAEYDDDDPV